MYCKYMNNNVKTNALLPDFTVSAVVFKHPDIFCFNEGRVWLLM